jgi:uncharacterized protein (DUF2267 family)
VPDERAAHAIEHAVMQVSGVVGVESHLHPGLVAGDTRPSEGAAAPPPASDALRALTDAARDAGARDPRSALHAVLCGFMDRLPADEALQVLAHLPADVRDLAGPPRRHGERAPRLRTVPQLVAAVTTEGGIESGQAEQITRAVVATLHDLVPEEASDVAAVLPAELRGLWLTEPHRDAPSTPG